MATSKLVRDKIPEIIKADGRTPATHVADDAEYWQKLREKLVEEAQEFAAEPSEEELADIWEVIEAIMAHAKFDQGKLFATKKRKQDERGGFVRRIILEE